MTPGERSHEPRAKRLWKHGTAPVIGLTGGVASGKSSFAKLLAERGFAVIDADSVGHDVLDLPGVQARLVDRFGPGVLSSPGLSAGLRARVDRKALAAIVFADAKARQALEAIVHPLMRALFLKVFASELGSVPSSSVRPVVLDAAILIEAGWDDLCDLIVFVDAPRRERLLRAAETRGWSDDDFAARERAQRPCDQKQLGADFVIRNDGTLDSLGLHAEAFLRALEEPAALEFPEPAPVHSPAEARASGRHDTDGPGSDAWHNSCAVS
jgi:dephospho-CoA kinase